MGDNSLGASNLHWDGDVKFFVDYNLRACLRMNVLKINKLLWGESDGVTPVVHLIEMVSETSTCMFFNVGGCMDPCIPSCMV